MPKSVERRQSNPRPGKISTGVKSTASKDPSSDAIKASEKVALAAFASGLKLAAAFGTVAAKTTSMALASLATGADKFSELVKKEAMSSSKKGFSTQPSTVKSLRQPRSKRRKRK